MIRKTVKKLTLKDASSPEADLAYWLSKKPEERVAAVDFLRGQVHGTAARIQRRVRVIHRQLRVE